MTDQQPISGAPGTNSLMEFFTFSPFELHPAKHVLQRNGEVIPLQNKAYQVLCLLVRNAGSVVTKDELIKKVWSGAFVEEANIPVQIRAVRHALSDENETYVKTIAGVGYMFVAKVEHVSGSPAQPLYRKRIGAWVLVSLISIALFTFGIWLLVREPEDQRLFHLALDYESKGDDEQALAVLDRAVKINPQFAEAYLQAGFVAHQMDQDDRSRDYLNSASKLISTRGPDFRLKVEGLESVIEDDPEEALKTFEILTKTFPNDPTGHYYLGQLAADEHRINEAEEHLSICVQINPKDPLCHAEIMWLQLIRNDFEGVIKKSQKLDADGVRYPDFYQIAGYAYLALNNFGSAENRFNELRQLEDSLHGRLTFRVRKDSVADAALYQGKVSFAISQLQQAKDTTKSPFEKADYALYQAEIYSLKGDVQRAKEVLGTSEKEIGGSGLENRAARILATFGMTTRTGLPSGGAPHTGEIGPATENFINGGLRAYEGKNTEAAKLFSDSHQLDEYNTETTYYFALAQMRLSRWKEASSLLKGIVEKKGWVLFSDNPYYWSLANYQLAICEMKQGDLVDAREHLSVVLDLWKNADPDLSEPANARALYTQLKSGQLVK